MAFLLDTNILIRLRDKDQHIMRCVDEADEPLVMSIISRVELESGIVRDLESATLRSERLDWIKNAIPALPFDDRSADAYATIIARTGYSRRKILDRMIAAQALVARATLVTRNAEDFADVARLKVAVW